MESNLTVLCNTLQSALGGQILQLLGALAILLLGWLIAVIVRAATRKGLRLLGVNKRFGQLTGQTIDIEKAVGVAIFWVVLLFALTAIFNLFDLSLVSGPFAALLTQLFEYAPRLLAGLVLALIAWLLASIVRTIVVKVLSKTSLDEKLSEHAGMKPIGGGLSQALFWLIILLFVPAILGALQMEGLLSPLREMVAKTVDIIPNVLAALIIGGVGWIVAVVLRNITSNLLQTAGADQLGQRIGLAESVQLSSLTGLLVFIIVFIPALIAALDTLKIEAVSKPATDMLRMMLAAVPPLIAAGLILVITWVVVSFASRLLASLLASLGFDTLPGRVGLAHAFEKTPASVFVGRVVLFFAMLFATVEAANQLGFAQVGNIVSTFIRFGGDILLGSLILVIGFWLAGLAYQAIDRASGPKTRGLAQIGRFAILALVLAMGLRAMGIADDIVNLAFGLTLGAIAVAIALSFGLGGREAAGKLMDHWLSRFRGNSQS
ncbi:MAG: mechanosensitive ion channel [Deltaproteobacteria bacterium]|nr:mechanosensitive ion channel [Deltaproteobacteria bacterium]